MSIHFSTSPNPPAAGASSESNAASLDAVGTYSVEAQALNDKVYELVRREKTGDHLVWLKKAAGKNPSHCDIEKSSHHESQASSGVASAVARAFALLQFLDEQPQNGYQNRNYREESVRLRKKIEAEFITPEEAKCIEYPDEFYYGLLKRSVHEFGKSFVYSDVAGSKKFTDFVLRIIDEKLEESTDVGKNSPVFKFLDDCLMLGLFNHIIASDETAVKEQFQRILSKLVEKAPSALCMISLDWRFSFISNEDHSKLVLAHPKMYFESLPFWLDESTEESRNAGNALLVKQACRKYLPSDLDSQTREQRVSQIREWLSGYKNTSYYNLYIDLSKDVRENLIRDLQEEFGIDLEEKS